MRSESRPIKGMNIAREMAYPPKTAPIQIPVAPNWSAYRGKIGNIMPAPIMLEKVHSASTGNTFFIMLFLLFLHASLQVTPLDRMKLTIKSAMVERTRLQCATLV